MDDDLTPLPFLSVTAAHWARTQAKWNHTHGISNVWLEPAVRGAERLKDDRAKVLHSNQKPLRLIERIITASSDAGDVVWEPFGGLCSAAIASLRTGRHCHSAEVIPEYYALPKARIHHALRACVSRPATDLPSSLFAA